MRWNKDEIDYLIKNSEIINTNDIAIYLGRTNKSIEEKRKKLGLKPYNPFCKIYCINCGISIGCYKSENRKFCSSNCSAIFNNKKRKKRSDESIKKTSLSLIKYYSIQANKDKLVERLNEKLKNKGIVKKEKKIRKCRHCDSIDIKFNKFICESCRFSYYEYYRPSCSFSNNIDYKNVINYDIVKELGWYSPRNKRNNLLGASKDHMYSVFDGFKNNIDPKIISHEANCMILPYSKNSIKNKNSIITIDELVDRIELEYIIHKN